MNLRLPLTVLIISLTLAPLARADLPTPEERAAKAKEFTALRLKFAASDAYHPDDDVVSDLRVQCADQMLAKAYAKAIELAERGLQRNPYNIHLLQVKASAYRALGDSAKADETRALWFGLMDSIMDSGDGDGYRTAFRVLSIEEEDAVLQALQLTADERRTVARKGVQYDVLNARNTRTGDKREVYFNVDLPKKWQDRQIAKRAASSR